MAEQDSAAPLRIGSRGPEVTNLQKLLTSLGHDPGAIDGVFGEATESAVRAYQTSNDMIPDGIVTARTSLAIHSALSGPLTKGAEVPNAAKSANTQDLDSDTLQAEPDGTPDHILASLRFSATTLQMMRVAVELAQGRGSMIFSETLYYGAIFIADRDSGISSDPVIRFLISTRPKDAKSDQPLELSLEDYANVPVSSLGGSPEPFGSHDRLPDVSDNARAILLRAQDLAGLTPEPAIEVRHLVGGMLLSKPVKQVPYARQRLAGGGQDLETLKRGFFAAVSSGWPNERDIWRSELGIETEDAPSPEPPETEDPLIERLLGRSLAVSTLGSKDVASAIELINGPKSWGLGPEIDRGDLLLIYFPKTLTGNSGLREFGVQQFGIRFLLRAGSPSQVSDAKTYRHTISIDNSLELREPVDPDDFVAPPLNKWSLPRQRFRRAGQETEPLSGDLARALWTLILERNSDQRSEIEALLDSEVRRPDTEFAMRNLLTRDTWTTEDELGYGLYAQAITDSIFKGSSVPPLTVGIQAPWGQGKTSLMRMIQKRFDPEAPERDLRKLETNGETAVAATFGHLHGWLKSAAKWNSDARERTPSQAADRRKSAPTADARDDRSPADTNATEDHARAVPFKQDQDIDRLPAEKADSGQLRRTGLLIEEDRRIPTV